MARKTPTSPNTSVETTAIANESGRQESIWPTKARTEELPTLCSLLRGVTRKGNCSRDCQALALALTVAHLLSIQRRRAAAPCQFFRHSFEYGPPIPELMLAE